MKDMSGLDFYRLYKLLRDRKFEEAGKLIYDNATDYEGFDLDS